MSAPDTWILKGGRNLTPAPFLVAGIVNVTPDSFYDGGRHETPREALLWGRRLLDEGADILDIGGESTRPGSDPVDEAAEMRRILPVVSALARETTPSGRACAVSVDTTKAAVAAGTLDAGAIIINDVSACRFDPGLPDVLAQYRPGYVLMHSQGRPRDMQKKPRYDNVVEEIRAFFEERLSMLARVGLPEEHIVLDPGIGFGKSLEHNLAILRRVDIFMELGRPLYIGISRKSLWQMLLGLDLEERGMVTQVATGLLAERGVAVHRVHDVLDTVRTLRVVSEFRSEL